MADDVIVRGPVTVANLTAAAGVTTTVDGWWPCLDITWRTPVPASITRLVAQVRERGTNGKTGPIAETVVTPGDGLAKIVNGVSVGQHLEVRLSAAGAPGLPFQPTPWLEVTTPWDELIAGLDGISLGCFKIVCGTGVPTRTDLPNTSLYIREDVSQVWRYVSNGALASRVQEKVAGGAFAATLSAAPTDGNWLVALVHAGLGSSLGGIPAAGAGWTSLGTHTPAGGDFLDVYARIAYKQVGAAESATQTPSSSTADNTCGVSIIEIAGLGSDFLAALSAWTMDSPPNSGFGSLTLTETTTHESTFAAALACFSGAGSAATLTLSGATWTNQVHAENVSATSNSERVGSATVSGVGQTVTMTVTPSFSTYSFAGALLTFGGGLWVKMSDLTSIRLNGVEIEGSPQSIDFVGDFDVTTDGSGAVTVTAHGPFVDVVCSEDLAAGKFVSFWNSSGAKVRLADNADNTKQADGFVRTAFTTGQTARVYTGGINDAVSGQTPGALYFLGSSGGVTTSPPTSSGTWIQELGKAADATHLPFTNKSGERN